MRRFAIPSLLLLLLCAAGFGVLAETDLGKMEDRFTAADKARADLAKRNRELEKLNRDLAARLNRGGPTARAGGPAEAGGPEAGPGPGGPMFRGRGGPGGRFAAIMNNPDVQRLMSVQQKAALDGRYAALFKELHLNPQDLEKFKNLLVEKQSALTDVLSAAREQGLDPRTNRDEIKQLVQTTQAEVDSNIQSTLGQAAFDQYKAFETTQPQRAVVSQLEQRLSYSDAPLTDAQSEQLVSVLATTADNAGGGGGNNPVATILRANAPGFFGTGGAKITDAAITQAQGILSAPQVAALQSLQQEQQASAQLAQQMRASFQRNNAAPANGSTPAPAAPVKP